MSDRPPLVAAALEFQKLSSEAFGAQRLREQEDLEFQVPEKQWSAEVRVQRAGQTVNGVPIPARPMLSIPKLDQPIQLTYNQWSRAHYGVQIHPISQDATDETAEVLQGLYRAIEVDSRAYLGRGWAFDRAVKAGWGCYRVDTCYDDATDDPDDQKIVIRRILRQASVYWDPFAVEPDFCDMTRCLIVSFVSRAAFKREYPDATLSGMTHDELLDMQSQMPNWARLNSVGQSETAPLTWYDGANDTVCVAEYFYTTYEDEPLPAGSAREPKQRPVVQWAKITACDVLDERVWNGKYIPVIPVIGRELQPFDTERRWTGMIGPNKDSARLFNYEVSNAVETDALRPKAPFIGAVGQFKTNQAQWQLANVRNLPYLEYDPVMAGGQLEGPPRRNETSVDLSSSIALIQIANENIQAGTALFDPSLGKNSSRDQSGRAVLAIQQQGDMSQSHFLQSMADISMTYEAKVVLDLIPKIYDRPGRIARILGEDTTRREVMLNRPFVRHPQTQRPMAAPMGGPAPMAGGAPGPRPPQPKHYDLRKGQYGIVVSVGKSYQTRAQEGSDALGEIIKGIPQTAPALLPIWLRFQDFPGHAEAEKVMTRMQPPGLAAPAEGEEEDAATLRQQRDQAMQIADGLKQQLAQAAQALQTDQAKHQAALQTAQIDAQTALQKAQLDAQVKIEIARLNAESDQQIARLKAESERAITAAKLAQADLAREDTQRFDHAEAAVDRHHDRVLAELDQVEGQRERAHAAIQAERQHEESRGFEERARERETETEVAEAEVGE